MFGYNRRKQEREQQNVIKELKKYLEIINEYKLKDPKEYESEDAEVLRENEEFIVSELKKYENDLYYSNFDFECNILLNQLEEKYIRKNIK